MQQLPQWKTASPMYLLFQIHALNVLTLEQESGVNYLTIWDVLVGNPQPEIITSRLLATIDRLKGTHYSSV